MPYSDLLSPTTLSCILRSCVSIHSFFRGKIVHTQVMVRGLLPDVSLSTDLLLMYSRCQSLEDAHKVFVGMPDHRSMHSWNIMIASYVQNSFWANALSSFNDLSLLGFRPDHYTVPCLLKACTCMRDLLAGRELHGCVVVSGLQSNVVVSTGLLDMYAKCGSILDAIQVFEDMSYKDVVSWNVAVSGLARAGYGSEALYLFLEMMRDGMSLDLMTVPSILQACGQVGEVIVGREVYAMALKVSFSDVVMDNALMDMYARCGCINEAHQIFSEMQRKDVVSWTTLIWCYGVHGKGKESLILFDEMIKCGTVPNHKTFTSVLTGCSHTGLLHQGCQIFSTMSSNYGLDPCTEHYACLVDLLGRHRLLNEALAIIMGMPFSPTASVWGALLSACRMCNNLEIGEIAASSLFKLEASNSSNYVVLASMYEAVGRWEDVSDVKSKMKKLGVAKTLGRSWLTINNGTHYFVQGDVLHSQRKAIYQVLDGMSQIMCNMVVDHDGFDIG